MSETRVGARYQIIDEPRPGLLDRIAMNPMLPFFAAMLLWPWGFLAFVLNSLAQNGAAKWIEILMAVAAVALGVGLGVAGAYAIVYGLLPETALPYLRVLIIAASMLLGYRVYLSQAETYELRAYFASLRSRA